MTNRIKTLVREYSPHKDQPDLGFFFEYHARYYRREKKEKKIVTHDDNSKIIKNEHRSIPHYASRVLSTSMVTCTS